MTMPPKATAAAPPPFPAERCWPLRMLADGRRPQITSAFWTANAERIVKTGRRHYGVDLFYAWRETDGPVRVGDGGAARDPRTGRPRWWIPPGTAAVASAAGVVVRAALGKTGHLVWIDHGCGWLTGYMHLRRVLVRTGDTVRIGDPVGEVGDNPVAYDATHLHFETVTSLRRYPGGCRDPQAWLRGALQVVAEPSTPTPASNDVAARGEAVSVQPV